VDVGEVRVGVAACDPHGLVASPVETVRAGRGDIRRIAELVAEREAVEVIVGLPRSLSGKEGAAAQKARAFAARLAAAVAPVGVRLVDERLTTVTATQNLRASGVRGRKARTVVDQAAAVVILQNALETERTSGEPPGQAVSLPETPGTESAGDTTHRVGTDTESNSIRPARGPSPEPGGDHPHE
jgi:putative Holliday junction resolvase